MGRSVSFPNNCLVLCFNTLDEDDDVYDNYVEILQESIKSEFRSFYNVDEWVGREDHVIAENKLVKFGFSEYCGVASYWLIPAIDEDDQYYSLAVNFANQIEYRFEKLFSRIVQIGTMSNGEAVYMYTNDR